MKKAKPARKIGGGSAGLAVCIRGGSIVAVPPTLAAITTYVLLEQEGWFEKETDFLRAFVKPGMTVLDIGANLGVYSLPLAQLVGPAGRVLSYEPGREARTLLKHSVALNGLTNLETIDAALSDGDRRGYLSFAASSELRALGASGSGEAVRITSLDAESATRRWAAPDFVKIDAEGEEERIIAGGRAFFAAASPLVMFEIKAGSKVNDRLMSIFPAMGYRLFRQLAGAPVLLPFDATEALDGYELNLFAAKPDRVAAMAQQNLLVEAPVVWLPGDDDRREALAFWKGRKSSSPAMPAGTGDHSAEPEYQDSLVAYATWRNLERSAATRCAALGFALTHLRSVCATAWTAERASTLARVAFEWGARNTSVVALRQLLQVLQTTRIRLEEPFLPASPRFDDIDPGATLETWFSVAAAEQYERSVSFSSVFSGASTTLDWLCGQPFASAEMERRRTLIAARAGQRPVVPERLRAAAVDHLNAEIWRSGGVPGTVLQS